MLWAKILIFIVCLVLGVFFLVKTERIVFFVGHSSWAERYLGPGGSYTMWKIIAILTIFLGIMFLWGKFDSIIGW
jgi:hypothetical protein